MVKVWKDIIGFEQVYEINNVGEVRNKFTGRILKSQFDGKGYLRTCLCYKGKFVTVKNHREVLKSFIPTPDGTDFKLWQVNHLNMRRDDNRLDNLEWCKQVRNQRHRLEFLGIALEWTKDNISLLGTMPDYRLAEKMGCNKRSVFRKRRELGIKSYGELTGNNGKFKKSN